MLSLHRIFEQIYDHFHRIIVRSADTGSNVRDVSVSDDSHHI